MSNQPIKNQEYSFYIFLVSQSTGQFQSNPTIAAGDFKRSIDGGAYANFTNLPVVDPAGSKSVKITFDATEMNSSNLVWLGSDAAGDEWDEVGGNIQPISWLDTNDDITGLAANTVTASALASDAVTEIQSGLSTLDAAGVRSAVGLASANLDTQLDALPTAAEVATAVWAAGTRTLTSFGTLVQDIWDKATSALTTAGSIGKLLVDNINATISSRLAPTVAGRTLDVTAGGEAGVDWANIGSPTTTVNLSGTTIKTATDVEADTADIQTRLPAALSGDGFIKADLLSIGDELVSGNNATLKLKMLDIRNGAGNAILAESQGADAIKSTVTSGNGYGLRLAGSGTGAGSIVNGALFIEGPTPGDLEETAILISASGTGVYVEGWDTGGKSINAPQGIHGSDSEDLSVTNIVSKVWSAATRTLTAISDSAGVTTLLSRIGSALNITGGKVESNVKQINDTNLTGDGSGTPWGPA